jgi:hypothetical protein
MQIITKPVRVLHQKKILFIIESEICSFFVRKTHKKQLNLHSLETNLMNLFFVLLLYRGFQMTFSFLLFPECLLYRVSNMFWNGFTRSYLENH